MFDHAPTSGLPAQIRAFFGVGVLAAIGHYSVLVGLVELRLAGPVAATLAGYAVGGVISYWLNRRHTYHSDRPHQEAGWRFAVVAFVGFLITGALMHLFVARLGAPYFPAQIMITAIVLVWSFVAHKFWTFSVQR